VSAKRGKPKPRRGDVVQVEVGEPNDPVKIRLHGHNCTYLVRVVLSKETGPELSELTMVADDGHAVDYEALRAVPVRRLANTAAQSMERLGQISFGRKQWSYVDDRLATFSHIQREPLTAGVIQAVMAAERALALGMPVRPTVAAKLGVSKTTVDRLLKRAKAEGLIEDRPLPKRPPPQQRDTTE
jgi:hypothetical protein